MARTAAALLSNARGRTPLLLVLGDPPPVKVQRLGRVGLGEAVQHAWPHLGPAGDRFSVAEAMQSTCWITWHQIAETVAEAASGHRNPDPSTMAAVQRTATGVQRAVARHSPQR